MEQGYDDGRFEKPVDENLHCVICQEVLRDPVQCHRNEHHFCRSCITRYLQHSQNCPTCKDPLTVETLGRPQRFLANTLSSLKISCENFERGCGQVVELGSLDTHVASCGFSPEPCSNDRCEEIVNRRDKEIHENKVCGFRRVKCDYCGHLVQYMSLMQHTCPARNEICEMKSNVAEMKAELKKLSSTQDEMLKMMQNMMSNLVIIQRNMPQSSEASCVSSGQNTRTEIVVAGGFRCKSVEEFNMTTKTWRPLSEMNERRDGTSSVLYQGHMFVVGGLSSTEELDTVEELNLAEQDGHWVNSQFRLPVPSRGHVCVVDQNRLLVIGGSASPQVYNSIHEILLTPPYISRLLTKMPQPTGFHGAVIVNDKVYIIGGCIPVIALPTNTVLMFDPSTNTCTELKPLPYPVSHMATVTWKDDVVLLGGADKKGRKLKKVILYNVTTGSHRMLPEMRKKRSGCTAVITGNNIIVMGGYNETDTALSSVECYNFDTNTWTEFPDMNEARVYATAVVKYC